MEKHKNLIIIIVVGIVAVGLFFLIKKIGKPLDEESQANKDLDKKDLTMTQTELKQLANRLWVAFKGMGTDENTAVSVVTSLKSKADWIGLTNAYDIDDDGMSLTEQFADEMTYKEMQPIISHLQTLGVTI